MKLIRQLFFAIIVFTSAIAVFVTIPELFQAPAFFGMFFLIGLQGVRS